MGIISVIVLCARGFLDHTADLQEQALLMGIYRLKVCEVARNFDISHNKSVNHVRMQAQKKKKKLSLEYIKNGFDALRNIFILIQRFQ